MDMEQLGIQTGVHLTGMRTNKLRPIKKGGGVKIIFRKKKKNTKIKREQGANV